MELDMDVNSDVVDHWLWLEMLRIEWLVGEEESGNTSAGLLPGQGLSKWGGGNPGQGRVEDILDNLVILDLINRARWKWAWRLGSPTARWWTWSTGWKWWTG